MRRRKRLPLWPLVALPLTCVVAVLVAVGQPGQQPKPTVRIGRAAKPAASTAGVPKAPRKDLAYYSGAIQAALFAPPAPPAPKVKPEPPKIGAPVAPAPVDPFVDYAYTGTVVADGHPVALIENSKTKEGTYLSEGDSFMGGTVKQISDRMLTIAIAGREQTLSKSDDFKLTPLDRSAAFLTATPQPGTPGGPPGMPGTPGGMPGAGPGGGPFGNMPADRAQRIQQFMERMTPEQRERMQNRFMNRQFEGQGGGRRRGFGGG